MLFHYLAFSWSLVVDAAEVEDSVYDDSVQLLGVGCLLCFGIAFYGVEADKDIAVYRVPFCIVEGDDVCIVIVVEVLLVYLKYFLVVAENVCDVTNFFPVCSSHGAQPCSCLASLDVWELDIFGLI